MIMRDDYNEDLALTLGLVRSDLRKLMDGRTYATQDDLTGGESTCFFLPDGFAVMAGSRNLGEDSSAQIISTFSVIAKPATVVVHDGSTEYELMFACFKDEKLDCISLGMERAVEYRDISLHELHLTQGGDSGVINVRTSLNNASKACVDKVSLRRVGGHEVANPDPYFLGLLASPTLGHECRSLHIAMTIEGEYNISRDGDQHRYIPNAWVSAKKLLSDPNTFEKLCPWSVQFVEALRVSHKDWTPPREQGLKTIC